VAQSSRDFAKAPHELARRVLVSVDHRQQFAQAARRYAHLVKRPYIALDNAG
jgi:hypothetical protein